ncbi:hypothetical protein AB0O75_33705 [Streptomyces sp. NPDC088921]|uniref:hypothetical protein n=1 Tax=unclassified Streptomyces TaxID=2593676 RepID=UPI00342FE256
MTLREADASVEALRFDLNRTAQAGLAGFPAASLSAAGRLPFRGRRTLDERIALLHQCVPTVEGLGVAASVRHGGVHGVVRLGEAAVLRQALGWAVIWDEGLVSAVAEAVHVSWRVFRPTANCAGVSP